MSLSEQEKEVLSEKANDMLTKKLDQLEQEEQEQQFKRSPTIAELQKQIGDWGRRKGWDFDLVKTPEKIALMHSELSEALEEYRKGVPPKLVYFNEDRDMKPEGIGIELADCLIRILHYADNFNINMGEMVRIKMEYNEKRPYRHGGLKA